MDDKEKIIADLRSELLRMELAYDDLFSNGDLRSVYEGIEATINRIKNEDQGNQATGENVVCFSSKGAKKRTDG